MEHPEGVYTINLGKVLLSQRQHRSVRAINMIREYAFRHMHTSTVKIDEELARQIWAQGVRRPPRKITVEMVQDGMEVLVAPYRGDNTEAEAPALTETQESTALTRATTDS